MPPTGVKVRLRVTSSPTVAVLEACSSVAERCYYMAEAGGSTPSTPTRFMWYVAASFIVSEASAFS